MGRDKHKLRRRRSHRKFVQIWHEVVESPAFRSLKPYAVAALVYLCDRYNGVNNGKIPFSVREVAECLHTGTKQAQRAMAELTDRGLVIPERTGWFSPDHGHATEWRITFQATDKPATNDFRNWKPKDTTPSSDTVVPRNTVALARSPAQKKFPVVSENKRSGPREHTSADAKLNDSGPREHTSDPPPVVSGTTHVHSSQGVHPHTAAADASNTPPQGSTSKSECAQPKPSLDARMEKITAVVTEAVAAMVAGGASDEVIYAEVDAAIAKLPVAGRLLPGASAQQMVANAIAAARHADPAIVALDEHQRPPAGQGRAP